MKKSKLILPIVATVGAVVPTTAVLVSMTSCNKGKFTIEDVAKGMASLLANNTAQAYANTNDINIPKLLKCADIIIENIDNKCVSITKISEKEEYQNQLKVDVNIKQLDQTVFTKTFKLFFNDVTQEQKQKHSEWKIKTFFSGICLVDDAQKDFECKITQEEEIGESEMKTKFVLYDDAANYTKLKVEKETEVGEQEHKYEYTLVKNSLKIEDYEVAVKKESGKTKVELEGYTANDDDEYKYTRNVTSQGVVQYIGKDTKSGNWERTFVSGEITYIKIN